MLLPVRHGFTLLEALIAIVIVGMAAAAASAAFGTELRSAGRAGHALRAAALAEQRLSALTLQPYEGLVPLPDSLARGRFALPNADYQWTATVRASNEDPALLDARVRIAWSNGDFLLVSRLYRRKPLGAVFR
ncbi:MAG: type II secretion system protein [Gemmatimonadaceae bacterium]|nr:type II secretion system protein [Gemmatimonadaceae bacterium]